MLSRCTNFDKSHKDMETECKHDCVMIKCSLAAMENREAVISFSIIERHTHDAYFFSRKQFFSFDFSSPLRILS